ncbi:hypothetical protein VB780_03470 [Leptolyngbya sp. CCNP1308]|uniref:hypothetical protein n=1 Tax=Leptolyngbya sp. CCNP1308 TaxID=3110255 RepID=UPI002B217AE0|nr:hypothetical protein [Leptolyngbya sp. CCNP1308]MEA5447614.1 hypothetical protein [Leptolyngbya sp. CCNP1308]
MERNTVRVSTQKGLIAKAREVLGEAGSALSDSELLNYALISFIQKSSTHAELAPTVQMVPHTVVPHQSVPVVIHQPTPTLAPALDEDGLSDDDWGVD